jgi:hypothetical protein
MSGEEFFGKTDEYIALFKNGKERYVNSVFFNSVIQMLVAGANPYEIIDNLCQNLDDQTKAFEQHIQRTTNPSFIITYDSEIAKHLIEKYEIKQ